MGFLAQLRRMRSHVAACPHPTKVKFDSQAAADRAASRRVRTDFKSYECVCGKWHLTTSMGEPECPICGAPIDEYTSCGCFEDIHYGR